jgi:PhnB protein
MASKLNPYLTFRDDARAAMEFYRDVFGGQLDLNTFGSMGDPAAPEADLIMHAQLNTPSGFTLMGSDAHPSMGYEPPPNGFSISLSGDDADDLRAWFAKLSDGGQVTMPMEKQTWGDEFGMLVDRFGISWMVDVEVPAST